MAKSEHYTKILAVERILQSRREVTIKQIIDALENQYGIRSERKSIYSNIAILTLFMPINTKRVNNANVYYLEKAGESNAET